MVCAAGADSIGLVFYAKSSRNVTIQQAKQICAVTPPFVSITALFLNEDDSVVSNVLSEVPIDLLQFHGTESPEYCQSFNRPYIKAVGMDGLDDFAQYARPYTESKGFLVDSHKLGEAGGSGTRFDWNQIPDYPHPIILAGGLNPKNVAAALMHDGLYGVDVSSGVESAPGVKDAHKVEQFINEVKRGERIQIS